MVGKEDRAENKGTNSLIPIYNNITNSQKMQKGNDHTYFMVVAFILYI